MPTNSPKHLKRTEINIKEKLKLVKHVDTEILENQQKYYDHILEIYQEAFNELIGSSITYSTILKDIKDAYENSLRVRDERIKQFITQDRVFGVSANKQRHDDKIKQLTKENNDLREINLDLKVEINKLKNDNAKLKDDKFSEYLVLMRERDARYTLYFENVSLQQRLRELSAADPPQTNADPDVLRIALNKCREQLTSTQNELKRMKEEYAETVPRGDFERLEAAHGDLEKQLRSLTEEHQTLQNAHQRLLAQKKRCDEEVRECRGRCAELERAGTPRPHWHLAADYIGGGQQRWRALASGLSSRDKLQALLRELGPAPADTLEYFEGLGTGPEVPPYLRYSGRVRARRLSRRELNVLVHDLWSSKARAGPHIPMDEYFTRYFEERYEQASVRAEWAYAVCAGAAQALEQPQVRVLWGALHARLDQRVYWGLRDHWTALRDRLRDHARDRESVTLEEFERVARATFPLKSEVDIRNLSEVVRKQLKLRLNCNDLYLDKLFEETEEGWDRVELARELFRQRQLAQDRYLRELLAALGGRHAPPTLSVDQLKRAFAIVDPAIDHIRMERYIRWAFSDETSELSAIAPLPLRTVVARLAAGDIERVGPRSKATRRHYK